MTSPLADADGHATLVRVRVQPGASRTAVAGRYGDELKVRVCSPPVDGRANVEVCSLVAALVGVKARDVEVVAGHTARSKVLRVAAPIEQVLRSLTEVIGPDDEAGR